MNYSTAIFALSNTVRGVMVNYDPEDKYEKNFLCKTFDQTIKVDDYVVVPTDTRHKMTVVKVIEVDVEPEMDSSIEYKWLVGRVDCADFEEIKEKEEQAIKVLRTAQKRRKKKEVREAMLEGLKEDEVKALPLYTIGEVEENVKEDPPMGPYPVEEDDRKL